MIDVVRRRAVAVAALCAVAALGAAGCGSSSDSGGPAKQLTIAQGTDPGTLDPQGSTVSQSQVISRQIGESLTNYDFHTHKFTPLLATSWRRVNANTEELRLRKGVKFTNGEPFDAKSVKYSIARIKSPELKSTASIYGAPFTAVKIVDPYTVRVIAKPATPLLMLYLSKIPMVPPKLVEEKGNDYFATHPVGTGPYVLSKYVRDDRVELTANPDYWGAKPKTPKLVFLAIPESSTRLSSLRAGTADIMEEVSPDDIKALEGDGYTVRSLPSLRVVSLQFNYLKGGPVADPKVRQALNYAVDKQAIVDSLLSGNGKVLSGQMDAPEYTGFDPSVKPYPYDPEKAKALLEQAGYTAAHPLRLTIYGPHGRYLRDAETLQAVSGYLEKVGVKATPEALDFNVFLKRVQARDLAPANYSANAPPPDAGILYQFNLTCDGGFSQFCDKGISKQIAELNRTTDPDARAALFHRITQELHDDPPLLFLFQQNDIYGLKSSVKGFEPRPDETFDLAGVSVG